MGDRKTDPIGLQTSVGRKLYPTNSFKTKNFFPTFNFMSLLIVWKLFLKNCLSFWQ